MNRIIKIMTERPSDNPQDIQAYYQSLLRQVLWAADSYDTVRIFNDGPKDMIAYYSNEDPDNNSTYVIGAIFDRETQKYSYHS